MKIYIIYRSWNCDIPQAITLDRDEAEKFMKLLQKHDKYSRNYWIEEKILSNKITEI